MSARSLPSLPSRVPLGSLPYCPRTQPLPDAFLPVCSLSVLVWPAHMPLSASGRRLLPMYKAQLGLSTTLRRLTGQVRAAWAWAWPTLAAALQVQLGGRSLPSQWRWSRGSRPQAEVSSPPPGENPPALRGRPHQRRAWARLTRNVGPRTPRCPQRKSCQPVRPPKFPATLPAEPLRLQSQLETDTAKTCLFFR